MSDTEQTPPAAPPIRRPGRPPKPAISGTELKTRFDNEMRAVADMAEASDRFAAEVAAVVKGAIGARIIEVRCDIPPELPGIGATTTLSVTDPPCKAKGVSFSLHKVGVLISYQDGSFFGVIPYAHVKRIRYDSDPR